MGQRPEKTFTPEQRVAIVARKQAGERVADLASELGISETAIYAWCSAAKLGSPGESGRPKNVGDSRKTEERRLAKEKSDQRKQRLSRSPDAGSAEERETPVDERPRRSTVADPGRFAHEDVIAFLAKLPPMPWALGDAIRLLAFHAIDGDFDDVRHARERIDAHLRALGEAA